MDNMAMIFLSIVGITLLVMDKRIKKDEKGETRKHLYSERERRNRLKGA